MPAVLCPKCRWPLSRAEARSGKCPFCAAPLGEAEAVRSRRRELPPPVDERGVRVPLSQAARPMIRGALILLALAAAGGGLYYAISAGVTRYLGGADAPAAAASEESKEFDEAFLAPETPPESEAAPAQPEKPPAAPASPPPAAPPAPDAKSAVRPVLSQEITVSRSGTKIDSPLGEYTVEPLVGKTLERLRGKVKTLRINGLDADAVLEAEALEAREIIFAGPVGGRAKARVRAPGGTVEFRGPISGEARVTVDAAGGKVAFVKPAGGQGGAEVAGQVRVVIKAKEVDCQCPLNGAAQIYVMFSAGAKLRFTEMGGASRIAYRKAKAKDPDLDIAWGIVRDEARCRENK